MNNFRVGYEIGSKFLDREEYGFSSVLCFWVKCLISMILKIFWLK